MGARTDMGMTAKRATEKPVQGGTTHHGPGLLKLGLAALALVMAALWLPAETRAQAFGQNRVNFRDFEWYYIKTEHFDIYYPKQYYGMIQFAGWEAEASLRKIEKSLGVKLQGRVIFVVFPSHNSFQNNNIGGVGESTGGFTEFLKNRVVIPYQGSYEMFRHVIHHELTHAFMLRSLYGQGVQSILSGLSRLPLPLWYIEGMAEFESQMGWSNEADMYIRDAIINDYLPPLQYLGGYFNYKGGQSLMYYLKERYGEEKVGDLFRRIRNTRNFNTAIKEAVGVELEELSKRWQRHLKRQIWPTAAYFESPEDFAERVTDHEKWHNFVNTSPALSPEGDRLVMLSDKDDYMSLYLVNTVTGKITEKLITAGGGIYLFEQLLWVRPWIDWAPNGREIAFVAEAGQEDALFTLDVESGEITREIRLGLEGVFSPSWSPDGKRIVIAGHDGIQSDLYVVEVDNPKNVRKITDDIFSDYDPDWGLGGEILFVSDRRDILGEPGEKFEMWEHQVRQVDAYRVNPASGEMVRLTDDEYETRTPTWTARGDTIAFVSDRSGAYNLYMMDMGTEETWAVTDILTGVVTPSWSEVGTVAFASFFDAGYDIYLYKDPFNPERRKLPSLTYYQQKVRGLLEQEAPDTVETEGGTLADRRKSPVPFPYVARPVKEGSAEEDSIRAALRDYLPDPEAFLAEKAAKDAARDSARAAYADSVMRTEGEMDLQPGGVPGDTAEVDTQPADTEGHGLRFVADIEEKKDQAADTTGTVAEADTAKKEQGDEVAFVSGNQVTNVSRTGSYDDVIFYPAGADPGEQVEEDEPFTYAQSAPDTIFNEQGDFIQREYELTFSPDIVTAAAGYSTFFGLQGYGQVMFSDVLGNHVIFLGTDLYYNFENSNFNLFYYYLPERWDFGGGVFHNVYFFDYGNIRDRNYGGTGIVSYPFNRNKRLDFSLGFVNIDRDVWDYQKWDFVQAQRRHFVLPSLAFVHDNTIWGWTGPINGSRYRISLSYSPKFSDGDLATSDNVWGIDFKTVSADGRKYFHIGRDYSLALRLSGAASFGESPQQFFLGGVGNWFNWRANGDIRVDIDDIYFSSFVTPLRGADFYERWGNRYVLTNTEFRFPLVRQLLFGWPLPFFFSNIRGALFMDAGAAWQDDNFRGVVRGPYGNDTFGSIVLGYGWGARINMGYFLLKFDMAWRNDLDQVTRPKYYFSIGSSF